MNVEVSRLGTFNLHSMKEEDARFKSIKIMHQKHTLKTLRLAERESIERM